MSRKIPKRRGDAQYIPLWRSGRRFLAQPIALSQNRRGKGKHFAGGQSQHRGSKCPHCKQPLTLLWDVDLSDPLFPDYLRDGFSPATRLPFYICWQCVVTSYTVPSNEAIKCLPFDRHTRPLKADETPFVDALRELPRRPMYLERVPSVIEGLLTLADSIDLEDLDPPARKQINDYRGKKIKSSWDLPISQLGGHPLLFQGQQNKICPNAKCPASAMEYPYSEYDDRFLMKDLALIHEADEPELHKHYFQMVYYICAVCFSIRAEYRCS